MDTETRFNSLVDQADDVRTFELRVLEQMQALADCQRSLNLAQLALLVQGKDGPVNGTNAETRTLQLEHFCEDEVKAVEEVEWELTRRKIEADYYKRVFDAALIANR